MTIVKVIAVDGPSGSGKSTIARKLAQYLGVLYVDTGAMYRAIGYICKKNAIAFEDGKTLQNFLNSLDFAYFGKAEHLIEINGEDLSDIIREHHISLLASKISKLSMVRQYLVEYQRKLATENVCVMEGRDIGTVVFPNAFCKVFLTAKLEIRAQRRLDQLKESGETSFTFEQVLEDVKKRDESDMNRKVAPLKQAHDAILVDASDKPLEDVLKEISEIARQKGLPLGIEL